MPLTTSEQFERYLSEPEGTRIEFKEAKNRYDFDKLTHYCVALANEGGGIIILGVSDKRPRQVVGSEAFSEPDLLEAGAVESKGQGKGKHHFLSRELYAEMGTPGVHTRRQGLDYETNKELLIKHLRSCGRDGAPMSELQHVLPAQSRASILRMLQDLRDNDRRVELSGQTSARRWFLRQNSDSDA